MQKYPLAYTLFLHGVVLPSLTSARKPPRPGPTPAPTPSPTSPAPLKVRIETFLSSEGTTRHPLSIVSPEQDAAGNTGHLTLSGGGQEPLYPTTNSTENCPYCPRFFGTVALYEAGTFLQDVDGKYKATIKGPPIPGVYTLVWKNEGGDKEVALTVEVSCNNGIHCDGEERFVRGECVPGYAVGDAMGGLTPYYFEDQVHVCIEEAPWAEAVAVGSEEGECGAPKCVPKCDRGQKCGSGGCPICEVDGDPSGACVDSTFADFCGVCDAGEECVEGYCEVSSGPSQSEGTCLFPFNLLDGLVLPDGSTNNQETYDVPAEGILGYLTNEDSAVLGTAEDNIQPSCNVLGSPEFVYKFALNSPMGFEVQVTGFPLDLHEVYDGYQGSTVDPLVAVHSSPDTGCDVLESPTGADYYCSDDSSPPGGFGSRLSGLLQPGTYTLIVSSYSANSFGPHRVFVKFTGNALRPSCAGKFCGDDSAEGSCGLWQYNSELTECLDVNDSCVAGRCSNCAPDVVNSPEYVSDCKGDQCGFDQCGLPCGNYEGGCPNKRECDEINRQCKPVGMSCDSLVPDCGLEQGNGAKSDRYCGTDCQLYRVDEKVVDLIAPTEEEVKKRMYFQQRSFTLLHCGVVEGSVKPPEGISAEVPFTKRMFVFDTTTHNLGESFSPPKPENRPDIFTWGECHGHYHFEKFAKFLLRDLEGEAVTDDRFVKRAYCMEDSSQYLSGPNIPCYATGTCDSQEISRGWNDNYLFDLDGQWIDLTGLYPGWYIYEVNINYARVFHERSFENNAMKMLLYVDPNYVCEEVLSYCDLVVATNACNTANLPSGFGIPPECDKEHPLYCGGSSSISSCPEASFKNMDRSRF